MRFRSPGRAFIVALLLAVGIGAPLYEACAAPLAAPIPFRSRLDHISYDIHPDYSYTVHREQKIEILSEAGVRRAQEMGFGIDPLPMRFVAHGRKVSFPSIYLLKKSGQKIPVALLPKPKLLPPEFSANYHSASFKGAEVGDTMVIDSEVEQSKPLAPGMFFMTAQFSLYVRMDDTQVTLRAPASLKLYITVQGMPQGRPVVSGNMREWTWRLHTGKHTGHGRVMIHASSYPDVQAESDAVMRIIDTQPQPPMTDGNRCPPIDPALPQDGYAALNSAAGFLAVTYRFNVPRLERAVEGWNIPSCVFLDGRPRLQAVEIAMDGFFSDPKDWSVPYDRIRQLKQEFPHKAFVAFLEADYWEEYAWNARGNGYSDSVTREGWKLFQERLEKAEQVLRDAKPYASNNPLWYQMMVDVQGWEENKRAMAATFYEGAKKFKTYYPLYFTMAKFLEPKWYGNWEAESKLVDWSLKNTRQADGESMYARLYWDLADDMAKDGGVFGEGRASWQKMRQGFRDMMQRYPKSMWNLNNFAKFACMAGDKNAYRSLRKRIGDNVMKDAWTAPTTLDLCEAKYGS